MRLSERLSEAIGDGSGPGGLCKCPECGHSQHHKTGDPCEKKTCSKCGEKMVRGDAGGVRPGRGIGRGRR